MSTTLNRRSFAAMVAALATVRSVSAQSTPEASPTSIEPVEIPGFEVPADALEVNIGFLPIMIYAPIYVALEKGYYAAYGLDVKPTEMNSGTDLTVMVSTNDLQFALSGVGPAFWNGIDTGLPLNIVAPGHEEGNPVATPLMAKAGGAITAVDQLAGKKVAVNAPGATEYWLQKALETGGLSIGDVDLQYLSFPDAVTALDAGALDAAMIGEPLATQGLQNGTLAILSNDFDVAGVQVTALFSNTEWIDANPEAAANFVAAYIQGCRDLVDAPNDPLNLTIINKYTSVPLDLIAASVRPTYEVNAEIHADNLVILQEFFGERELLAFDEPIDPATVIRQDVIDAAIAVIGAR
ncbi:MAG: ABC transporter substrate-binding protein [Thermomicrobiales bacterium]|nr:ABC transporter substrate-binding protein [Thermomicrobiales bacterium]